MSLSHGNDRQERDLIQRERTRAYRVDRQRFRQVKAMCTCESDISELWRANSGNSNQLLVDTGLSNESGDINSNLGGDDKYNTYDKRWGAVQQVSIQESTFVDYVQYQM